MGAFDGLVERAPGTWRRKGENGPPIVTDPNGEAVKSGPNRGQVKLLTYSRPSNYGKQVENTFNLERWQQRQGVIGMHLDRALLDEMAALWEQDDHDSKEWKSAVDGVYTKAATVAGSFRAAERGTHGHLLTEDNDLGRSIITRIEAGEDLGLSPAIQHAIAQAWAQLVDEHFEVLAVEAACVNDRWRVAGTLDRIVRLKHDLNFATINGDVMIPAGTVIVLDVKTGGLTVAERTQTPTYWHSYAVQVVGYSDSVPYDVDAERRGVWPWPISRDHAVIAHIDIATALETGVVNARLVYVDLNAGRDAGDLVAAAKAWQNRRDVFGRVDAYEISIDTNPPIDRVDVVTAVRAIVDAGHADTLALRWPAGVPGLGTDHEHTPAELAAIVEAVRTVNADKSMPFTAVDVNPFDEPPPPEPWLNPAPVAPVLDDGPRVSTDARNDLNALYAALEPTARGDVDRLRAELPAWDVPTGCGPHERHWCILRAAVLWAQAGWDDDIVRDLTAAVTRDDSVRQPAVPLGTAWAALTIDQANDLAEMALRVLDGTHEATHQDRWTLSPAA